MFPEIAKFIQCRGVYEWGHCFGCLHFNDCAVANRYIFSREDETQPTPEDIEAARVDGVANP